MSAVEGRRRFVRDTLLFYVSPLAQNVAGLFALSFVAKYVGAEGYGVWTQIQATIPLLALFVCMNLGHAMNRFLVGPKDPKTLAGTFNATLIFTAALSLVAGAFLWFFRVPLASLIFGGREYVLFVVLLAPLLLLRVINVEQGNFLRARRFIGFLTFGQAGHFFLIALLVSLFAFLTRDMLVVVSALFLGALALFLAESVFLLKKGFLWAKPDFSSFLPLLAYGAPLLLTTLGYWVVQVSDRYLINYFLDIEDVGVYAASYGIAMLVAVLWTSSSNVLLADFSSLYDQGESSELAFRFSRLLKYEMALSIGAVAGFVLLGKEILTTLASSEFARQPSLLWILGCAMVAYGLFNHFSSLASVLKKVRLLNSLWFGMAFLNIVLNLLLIPTLGILGAALSTLFAFVLGALYLIYAMTRHFPVRVSFSWLWKIAVACALMALVVSFLPTGSSVLLFLAVGAGMLVFGGALLLLKFPEAGELAMLKKIL